MPNSVAEIIGEVDWKEVSAAFEAVDDVSFTNNVDSRSYGHMGCLFFFWLYLAEINFGYAKLV